MPTERPRVLIIDDDPIFSKILERTLCDDYTVLLANDGSDGFFKALRDPPDLAIIDVMMPDWDGMKTLAEISNAHSLKNTRMVMLTGDASPETVKLAMHSGADRYFIKPNFSRTEFLRMIRELLMPDSAPAHAE